MRTIPVVLEWRNTSLLVSALLLAAAGTAVRAAEEPPAEKAGEKAATSEEPAEYRNWFTVGVGGIIVDGDRSAFQHRHGVPEGAYGGVEDFHYEQDVGKRGLFTADGHGIFDHHDYDVRVSLSEPDKGYFRAGYRQFRTWYDGSGGYFPRNGQSFSLYDEEFAIDRGEAWFEGGLTLPDWPEIRIRYSHQFREGNKDSSSWGDSSRTGIVGGEMLRGIVPSYWSIDETRDLFEIDARHTLGNTGVGIGIRAEYSDIDNARNMRRRPGELGGGTGGSSPDRHLTQKDQSDADLFNAHGFTETRFNDKVLFTTGYSFTTMDTDISGSRIYGADYDPVYDPVFARRQQRDEGFINLAGGSQVNQHVANLNLMLTPWDHVTIVPSLRIEHQDQEGLASFLETNVGGAPDRITAEEEIINTRERSFTDVSEGLEARYTGATNWVFYGRGEWLQGEGDLRERESEAQTGLVIRDTDSTRFTQKYAVGANWYPQRKLNLGGQYYYKVRQNDYDHVVDSTPNDPASGDRYPAFLERQDFDTHDMNVRLTWRPFSTVTLITRYDFQLSTIHTRGDFLAEVQSSEGTAHILSESASWTPISRLFLQGSINYVLDEMDSPVSHTVPGANIVLKGKNNYWNASLLAGLVLTEKTDLQAQYTYYLADNYEDNSTFGMPYGSGLEEHGVTATLTHRFNKRIQMSLRYGFFTSRDETSGDRNDYDAHMVSTSFRYLF